MSGQQIDVNCCSFFYMSLFVSTEAGVFCVGRQIYCRPTVGRHVDRCEQTRRKSCNTKTDLSTRPVGRQNFCRFDI